MIRNVLIYFIIVICSVFYGCKQNEQINNENYKFESISYNKDSIRQKLLNAIQLDSFKFYINNYPTFLYLKTGNILTPKYKNAIVAYYETDSIYRCHIELYSIENKIWAKLDEIVFIDCLPINNELIITDFNFDGIKDLFIPVIIDKSHKRYKTTQGPIILIDYKNKKLLLRETRNLVNLKPDSNRKIVYSIDINSNNSSIDSCILENKWVDDKLITFNKNCYIIKIKK